MIERDVEVPRPPPSLRTVTDFCKWVDTVLELDGLVELRPDSSLAAELGFDSLVILEIILAAEEDFDLAIDEALVPENTSTLGDLYGAIRTSLSL
jgi:acyl carrier protein